MLLLSLTPLCSERLIFTTGFFLAQPGFQHAGADAVELVLGGDRAQCIALLLVSEPVVAVQHRLRGVEPHYLLRCAGAGSLQRELVAGESVAADAELRERDGARRFRGSEGRDRCGAPGWCADRVEWWGRPFLR